MDKDWSFLITERPDRPKKPETLDGDHTPFSWAYVIAWLIEMGANAKQSGGTSVPVLSVQQVIDHSDIDDPVTEHQGFKGNRLHAVALDTLSKKEIGIAAADNYRPSTLPENETDAAEVKLRGMEFCWIVDDHVMHMFLSKGPVATCIKVTKNFIDYDGGIYCEHKAGTVRSHISSGHYVLVLGSGTEDGVKYWKIFNPWSDWGESNAAGVRGFGKICMDESCGFVRMRCLVMSHVDILSNEN